MSYVLFSATQKVSIMQRRLYRLLCVLSIYLLSIATSSAATSSIDVNVPQKNSPGELQIALMELVIQVDTEDPISFNVTTPDGSTDTSAVMSPGDPSVPSDTMFFGSDFVSFFPPDATLAVNDPRRRNYIVRIQPNSDFGPSCTTVMSGSELWQFDVSDGTNRVINGCLVSQDENTAVNACNGAYRPVPITEAVAEIVGLNSEEQSCRFGLESMLVLDRSGSMGSRARPSEPVSPTNTKIGSLRNAVSAFTSALSDVRTSETDNGFTVPTDELGVAIFNTSAEMLPGIPSGLNTYSSALASDIDTQLSSVNATGGTSIGDGVILAAGELGPQDMTKRRVILLMSDGKQNSDQRISVIGDEIVSHPGTTACPGGSASPDCDVLPNDGTYSICAVTVGTSTAVDPAINQEIALAGDCFYLNSEDNAAELSSFFLNVLQNFLEGSTWQTLISGPGTVTEATPVELVVPVTTTSTAIALTLVPEANDFVCVSLIAPGEADGEQRCGSNVLNIQRSQVQHNRKDLGGDWRVQIRAPRASSENSAGFSLNVMADDHGTHSYADVDGNSFAPGTPMSVQIRLEEFGEALTGLAGPDFSLRLGTPNLTIGEVMAAQDVDSSIEGDDDSAAADIAIADAVASDPSVLLDEQALISFTEISPGVYEASFTIEKPGHADLVVSLQGQAPRGGTFSRQLQKTIFVKAIPDEEQTTVQTQIINKGGESTLAINLTPRTVTGYPVGPGWQNYYWLTGAGVEPFKLTDNLNGSYSGSIDFTGLTPPQLDVHFIPDSVSISDLVPATELPSPLDGSTSLVSVNKRGGAKWAIGAYLGVAIPDSAATGLETGPAFGLSAEYLFTTSLSLDVYGGVDQLAGKSGFGDLDITRLSLGGKYYLTPAPYRFYAGAALGSYSFNPGSSNTGLSIAAGLLYELNKNLALDAQANIHTVDNSGSSFDYYNMMLGIKYRF